jgi:SET domain-containing protein
MVIEYIGELIRNEVANKREKLYEQQNRGIYMFRLDEENVVDATMSGCLARYINHCCEVRVTVWMTVLYTIFSNFSPILSQKLYRLKKIAKLSLLPIDVYQKEKRLCTITNSISKRIRKFLACAEQRTAENG